MNADPPASGYVKREEERYLLRELEAVRGDQRSRAILLYGPGGIGKTSMMREMSRSRNDASTVWVEPIDVDDPEYWLLSNLERKVADALDPAVDGHFAPYRVQLAQLPDATHSEVSHETIVSHLARIRQSFVNCYAGYVGAKDKTVVIIFDTVETVRGTNVVLTLTRWMKDLPASTLFILSGRPPGQRGADPADDPIRAELDSYEGMARVSTVNVGGFSRQGANAFIGNSPIAVGLEGQELEKLVLLTRGHPLWIAFMIDYLAVKGMPEEVTATSVEFLERHLPYGGKPTAEGKQVHELFLRRLVAPYQESDFWHETMKRLAIVRQPVARTVWQQLMEDLALPDDAPTPGAAWRRLLSTPWIRPRGNFSAVTLHDAVAEEFALRLFPLIDQDQRWRRGIWARTLEIYDMQASLVESKLTGRPGARDSERRKREFDQLRAATLYYTFLCDFEKGCEELLVCFREAKDQHDVFFQDLMVLYLQRFLPEGTHSDAFNDVVRAKLDEFRGWLTSERPDLYVALGITVAKYLIDSSQSREALATLGILPSAHAAPDQRHRIHILSGNACLRVPDRAREGKEHFRRALDGAKVMASDDQYKFIAEAHKEYGFYYRNVGLWYEADEAYQCARDAISSKLSPVSSAGDRDELASIQTNWAYVKGLNGSHRDGIELARTAIKLRERLNCPLVDIGMSWSVCGEVYRYAQRFHKAWAAYETAERMFFRAERWDWLGLLYQEQAICLYQATLDEVTLVPDQLAEAKRLIGKALDICPTNAIRAYPSALNRAGRIFAHDDPGQGLHYLKEGISEARRLSDGWFWFANMIEYAELSYRLFDRAQQNDDRAQQELHRASIASYASEIEQVAQFYSFPDLAGRWKLLQGHLAVHDYLDERDDRKLDEALADYQEGFASIAEKHVGSSGMAALPHEFRTFRRTLLQLPEPVQAKWQMKLRSSWGSLPDGATLLLAHLEELY